MVSAHGRHPHLNRDLKSQYQNYKALNLVVKDVKMNTSKIITLRAFKARFP